MSAENSGHGRLSLGSSHLHSKGKGAGISPGPSLIARIIPIPIPGMVRAGRGRAQNQGKSAPENWDIWRLNEFLEFFSDARGCIYVTGLNSLGFRAFPPWSRARCSKFHECNLSPGCGEKRISPSQQLNPPSGGKAPAASRPRWNYLHFVSFKHRKKNMWIQRGIYF